MIQTTYLSSSVQYQYNFSDFSDNKDIFININKETDLLEYKELIDKNFKSYE